MKISPVVNLNQNVNFNGEKSKKRMANVLVPLALLSSSCSGDKVDFSHYEKDITTITASMPHDKTKFEKLIMTALSDITVSETDSTIIIEGDIENSFGKCELTINKPQKNTKTITGTISTSEKDTDKIETNEFSATKIKSPFDKEEEVVLVKMKNKANKTESYFISQADDELIIKDSLGEEVPIKKGNKKKYIMMFIVAFSIGLYTAGQIISNRVEQEEENN